MWPVRESIFRSIFPTWYMAPAPAQTLQQLVIANWLAQEIDAQAEERMPALREIRGWRRRDVLTWLEDFDWTEGAEAGWPRV
jgi:hypothetical protein